jgi:hypothetical protein
MTVLLGSKTRMHDLTVPWLLVPEKDNYTCRLLRALFSKDDPDLICGNLESIMHPYEFRLFLQLKL